MELLLPTTYKSVPVRPKPCHYIEGIMFSHINSYNYLKYRKRLRRQNRSHLLSYNLCDLLTREIILSWIRGENTEFSMVKRGTDYCIWGFGPLRVSPVGRWRFSKRRDLILLKKWEKKTSVISIYVRLKTKDKTKPPPLCSLPSSVFIIHCLIYWMKYSFERFKCIHYFSHRRKIRERSTYDTIWKMDVVE